MGWIEFYALVLAGVAILLLAVVGLYMLPMFLAMLALALA